MASLLEQVTKVNNTLKLSRLKDFELQPYPDLQSLPQKSPLIIFQRGGSQVFEKNKTGKRVGEDLHFKEAEKEILLACFLKKML